MDGPGSIWLNPRMETIGKAIASVMGWYDHLQMKLGLPDGEKPKFERFFAGKCREE